MPDDGGAGGEGAEQHAGPGQGELMGDLKYKTSDLLAAIPDEEQDESTRKFEQEVLVSYGTDHTSARSSFQSLTAPTHHYRTLPVGSCLVG